MVTRIGDGPLIDASTHPSIGENIQGPSLVKMPDWCADRLGTYHLYFADHKGSYIRLAFADDIAGPWHVHEPGSLQLADSLFLTEPPPLSEAKLDEIRLAAKERGVQLPHDIALEVVTPHIASPDVHVDAANRRFVMYFHGLEGLGRQVSRVAVSDDGINFSALPETLEQTYLRVFAYDGMFYGLAMPGQLYRSANGIDRWEEGPRLFEPDMRHCAVRLVGETLDVFWSRVGDAPERILLSTVSLSGDWSNWTWTGPVDVLRPELAWEGAEAPNEPSVRSVAYGLVNQLRDPAIHSEGDRLVLLYAFGGESGIAAAELHDMRG